MVAGYHRSYGTQPDFHRDGHNARQLASAFFFGRDFNGGELIFPHLGIAFYGGPGHSVHGCYDSLPHGIGQVRADPEAQGRPPIRISLAMYPQGSVYSGAARLSAAVKGLDRFSDPDLWLPFYPPDFNVEEARLAFKEEEKKLYRKYRDEVYDYQAPERAAKEKAAKENAANKKNKKKNKNSGK